MTEKVGSLSCGPACEAGKLIVEVIGKDHPAGQRIVIYDETDNQQQEALTKRRKLEALVDPAFSSTLHIWPWDNEPTRHLWLEIETEKGGPIRVPLMDDARATPRQADQQWNQIVPIVPLTPMRGSTNEKDQGIPVLARPGYFYVFYRGKLWRELEIRQNDGKNTYHDIDVKAFRQQNGFCIGPRDACGKGLEEIWLPARWNRDQVSDIELAFAEVQLPAARLQRLEQDAKLRAQRCQRFSMQASAQQFKKLGAGPDGRALAQGLLLAILSQNAAAMQPAAEAEARRRSLNNRIFPLNLTEPQRLREPLYEPQFDHPTHYLHDLAGSYPAKCYQAAQKLVDGYEAGQAPHLRKAPELDPLAICLERKLLAMRPPQDQTQQTKQKERLEESAKNWQAQPAVADALADARTRQIAGLLVEDAVYRMRQLRDRIEAAQASVSLAAERASLQPHYASALLVSNFVLPLRIDGKANPLSRCAKALDAAGHERIRHVLAEPLGHHAQIAHGQARRCLASCLKEPSNQQALGDLFCLDGFDYLGAFALTGQCMASMAKRLNDPLNLSFRRKANDQEKLLLDIADSNRHPLHAMLWPTADQQICMAPYQSPTGKEENLGDGRLRPKALAALENAALPKPDNVQLLEAAVLIAAAQRGDFKSLLGFKNSINALMSVLGVLQGALQAAENAVTAAQDRVNQAVAEVDTSHHRVGQSQEVLRNEARMARLNMYEARSFQLSRIMLPETLGAMRFERSGRVNTRDHYIVRPDLLGMAATGPGTRMTGSVRGGQGDIVATSNAGEARAAGLPAAKQEHLLVVLPARHETTQRLERLYQQLRELFQAQENLNRQQTSLNEATRAYQARLRSGVYRTLNSPIMPPLMMMIELRNVQAEIDGVKRVYRERGAGRAITGTISAFYDAGLAFELLAERAAHDTKVMRATIAGLDRTLFRNRLVWGNLFAANVTARMLLGAVGAVLFTGLNISDAINEFALGDDAGWGYALMAAGGLATFASAFMAGPAAGAPLLALGPAGWMIAIGLALTLAGAALVWWLDDTPVEEWLKLGPFGQDQPGILFDTTRPAHLLDEQEAFYRLVGLFAGIHIQVEANPEQAKARNSHPIPGQEARYHAMREANMRIRIASNLPGLINSLGASQMRIGVWQRLHRSAPSPRGDRMVETVELLPGQNFYLDTSLSTDKQKPKPTYVVHQEQTPAGLDLYLRQPPTPAAQRGGTTFTLYRYSWAVRAQVLADNGKQQWHFPAPPPTDPLRFNAGLHGKPNYTATQQAFWADEESN